MSCSVLQRGMQCVEMCCSMLQYVAVCCSMLQCAAARRNSHYTSSYIYICIYMYRYDDLTLQLPNIMTVHYDDLACCSVF